MSWCAGFTQPFYDAYFSVAPKSPMFEARRDLYTLYHILNVRETDEHEQDEQSNPQPLQ